MEMKLVYYIRRLNGDVYRRDDLDEKISIERDNRISRIIFKSQKRSRINLNYYLS